MATATLRRELRVGLMPAAFLPPPPLPPHRRIRCGAGDEDPADLAWIQEMERLMAEEENGETAFGCDYSDGPMSPTGGQW